MRRFTAAGISAEQTPREYPNDAGRTITRALVLGFLAGTGLTLMLGLLLLPLSGSARLVEAPRSGEPSAVQARQIEIPAPSVFAAVAGNTSVVPDAGTPPECREADLPYELTMGDPRPPCD